MPRIPLHYVDLRTFCYATEDERRVESALRTLLPEGFEIERAESEGHYGDRILVLSARVENAGDVRTVLTNLTGIEEFDRLVGELDERVTENTELFFRVDKQAAFQDEIALGEGITVRAKVEAYPATKEAAVENAREVLEDLEAEAEGNSEPAPDR